MHKRSGRFRTCEKPAIQAFAQSRGFWKHLYFALGFWTGWQQKATQTLRHPQRNRFLPAGCICVSGSDARLTAGAEIKAG